MYPILFYNTFKFCINIYLYLNHRKLIKFVFISQNNLLLATIYNFDEYTYILQEKTNFHKIILIFSPIPFHLNLIYTLGTRESSPAPSLISPVEQFQPLNIFATEQTPYLHTLANRLVVICTPATLIETRYIPNYSHCAGFALSHYRFNVRIPFICRAKLFNQPS